jgi:hypothetical protein
MPILFSYGTLQDPAVQLELFARRVVGKPDEVIGFKRGEFRVADPEFAVRSGSHIHAIVHYTGRDEDRTPGTVLELSDAELAAADAYEPAGYTRIRARLASGLDAWVYAGGTPTRRNASPDKPVGNPVKRGSA